jgi:hypothetical protein
MVSEKAASQNGSPIAASIATKAMSNGVMSNGAARTNVDFMIKTSESQLTLVQKTASHTRYKTVRELPDINDGFFDDMDIERFLDYTTDQRVMNVPDRGSQWDKVLNSAEYFGLQLQAYGEMLEKFAHESMHAVNIALGSCRLLLELGHQNAAALSSSFTVFSKIGRSLSPLLRNDKLFTENHHTHEELASIFANLLELISDVAIYYRKRVNDVTAGAVVIDFHHVFGRNISAIYKRKDRAVGKLWSYKLGHGMPQPL